MLLHPQEGLVLLEAGRSRAWAERFARAAGFPSNLCGLCAIASQRLHESLARRGIRSWLVAAESDDVGHVYLRVGGALLDVTATQFGSCYRTVEWRDAHELADEPFWTQVVGVHAGPRSLREFLQSQDWPDNQIHARRAMALGLFGCDDVREAQCRELAA